VSSLVNETYIVACMISVYIYIMFQVTHLRALKLPLVCINSGYAARIFRIILYCDSIVLRRVRMYVYRVAYILFAKSK